MRTPPLVALSMTAALLLSSCGADDKPRPAPSTGAAASSSAGGSASASPEPSVAPADGPLLDGAVSTVRAPQGWTIQQLGVPFSTDAADEHAPGRPTVQLLEGPWGDAFPLDHMAQAALKGFPQGTREEDTTLGGEPAYHVRYNDDGPVDEIGLTSHDRWVRLSIRPTRMTSAERDELVASIAASFRWKD